jgi:hypothetical protein
LKKLIPILQNLIYTTYLAELLPFSTSLFFIKKINSRGVKVFFFYVFAIAFFLCLSLYFKFIEKDPVHQLLVKRGFLLVEFALLSKYYYYQLQYKYKKSVFFFTTIAFTLYSVFDYLTAKSAQDFSFMPLVIECLFFALLIIYFFYEKIQYNVSTPILNTPEFWISVAFLLYFTGNFFLFLFSKSMLANPSFRNQYIIIYGTITIIKDLLLTVAILVHVYLNGNKNRLNDPIEIDLGTFNPLQKNKPNL